MRIIEQPGYFTSLPREYYVSGEIFERELERVFERQWLYVGHVSQVPHPGDYIVRDVGPESLIIARGHDERVRAFFNVCRHRGAQLCEPGSAGHAKQFVCPYHRWSYASDGHLLGAPGSRDGLDFAFEEFGLHEAHCDVAFGSIFVWLSAEEPAMSLADAVLDLVGEGEMQRVQPERTKLAHEEIYTVRANWKLMLENNVECYHCAGAHPSLGVSCNYAAWFLERDADGRTFNPDADHFPLRDGMQTFSMDGRWVCRKPLGAGFVDRFSTGYVLVPNFSGILYFADHGVMLTVQPVTVDVSRLTCQWFVHEDAVEGEDYDVPALIGVFHVTNEEDAALAELNQRGVNSRRFTPGPNSATRESFLRGSLEAYLDMMQAGEAVATA